MSTTAIKGNFRSKSSHTTSTCAHQYNLPKLPIPPLEETCRRYLTALKGLQDEVEHKNTIRAVQAFLDGDGPRVQDMLLEYSKDKSRCVASFIVRYKSMLTGNLKPLFSYIEEFWYDLPEVLLSEA